jgi:hypothetical protein
VADTAVAGTEQRRNAGGDGLRRPGLGKQTRGEIVGGPGSKIHTGGLSGHDDFSNPTGVAW